MNKNVKAFLDTLAYSEGTSYRGEHDGYDIVVGGGCFTSYKDHPRKMIRIREGLVSSAAGRYQFIVRTWDELRVKLGLKDFSPASQDLACVEKLRQRGALDHIIAGRFDEAVFAARKEWASLPGAGYGQHENKLSALREHFIRYGGTIA